MKLFVWLRSLRLRTQLALMIAIGMLPVIGGLTYDQWRERGRTRERTLEDTLRVVRLAAGQQASIVEGTQRLLQTLSVVPGLHEQQACSGLLLPILRDHPGYLDLAVVRPDGVVICSSLRQTVSVSVADRAWFQRAVASRETVIGDYQVGRVTGQPGIVVARPLFDASGQMDAILAASLGLDQFDRLLAGVHLPAGSSLTLFDASRTILARYPDPDHWVGKRVPDALVMGGTEEVTEARGVDGVERVYVTVPLAMTVNDKLYIGLGVASDRFFADVNRRLYQQMLLIAVAVLGAAGAAFYGSGVLGRARQRGAESSSRRYRLMFDANPQPMWVYDVETLKFLDVNDAAVRKYGYSRDEFLAMRIVGIRPDEDVPVPLESMGRFDASQTYQGAPWRHRLKSGEVIDVEISSSPLTLNGRAARLMLAQDVTVRRQAELVVAERGRITALIADVGIALNRPVPFRECLQECANGLVQHLDAAQARIWIMNGSAQMLELQASAGLDTRIDGAQRSVPVGQLQIGRIAREARPMLTNRVTGDANVPDQEWAAREGIVAFAGHPLLAGGRVMGVMAIFARHPLTDAVTTALAAVADHVALGIVRHQAESERRLLATVVDNSNDAILAYTLDGIVLAWNSGAEALYGYMAEEMIGRTCTVLVPSDRLSEVSDHLAKLAKGEHFTHYETVRVRKDGTRVSVSLSLSPIRGVTGQIVGASSIARDIGERRRAEMALRASEEQNRLLARAIESSNDMISVTDVDDRITFVNNAFLETYGYQRDEVIGQTPSLIQSSRNPPEKLQEILRETRRGGWYGMLINRRKDGSELEISLHTSVIKSADGEIAGLLGVARDITNQISAEQALHDAEQRMQFALEASHVGVWEADLRSGASYWSETFEALHGATPGRLGKSFEAFVNSIHPDDRADVQHGIDHAIREHRTADLEYRVVWPDGSEHRISSTGQFFYDEQGAPIRAAGVSVDITQRRSLEDQYRQAQKMEAVGQLAGGIAHDFNNMLTAILGYAELLKSELPEGDMQRADVEEIVKAARRAATLTQQLLAFSRKQILTPRVLHLGDVISDLAPMLRRLLGETIDLRSVAANRGRVKADAGQIEQILMNLAVNARDAMRAGGRLTIETADVTLDDDYARQHAAVRPGSYVMVAVTDTGVGMDGETQKRVFDPFFTTKPKGQGTGLGLAMVYGIVTQSGGHIAVYSELNYGTTFKIYLPVTDEAEELDEPEPLDPRALRGAETILVVEDEDVVREFVIKVLARYGYTTHAMSKPSEAIDFVGRYDGLIHLLLTDVVLPGMSGRDMATRVLALHPEPRVLYMSGYTDDAIVHHGVLEPGMAFLQKPFSADALIARVREVLDGVPVNVASPLGRRG